MKGIFFSVPHYTLPLVPIHKIEGGGFKESFFSSTTPALSAVQQKLVREGKLEERQSLEDFFTQITEKEMLVELENAFLRQLQDQVKTGIKEREREIMELREGKRKG